MMIEIFQHGVLATLLAANNTAGALELLQSAQFVLEGTVEGMELHAEVLYCAIKNANQEILQFLLNIPVLSDISFFKFCGHTPISLAVENGCQDLIPLLLAKTDKNFALHMAVKLKQEKTRKLLLSKCIFKTKLLQFLGIASKG